MHNIKIQTKQIATELKINKDTKNANNVNLSSRLVYSMHVWPMHQQPS